MPFRKVRCQKCGANFEVDEARTSFNCPNCAAIQVDHATSILSSSSEQPGEAAEVEPAGNALARLAEAEQYKLQAEFILHALQANVQVYGSNSAWSGAQPADVELAIRYINRSLEYYPDNPVYLNLKALLLIEGMSLREEGIALLERAHQLNPRDITIENNLKKLKSSAACFIATAAYGSGDAWQVRALRRWRDEALLSNRPGTVLVKLYYRWSPPAARTVSKSQVMRSLVRTVLFPITRRLARRYMSRCDQSVTGPQ